MTQPSVPMEPSDKQAEVEPTFDDYELRPVTSHRGGEIGTDTGSYPG